mgnify:FL=1
MFIMKKILVLAVLMLSSAMFVNDCVAQTPGWRKSITIHFDELNHPSTRKLFNQANKACQYDNLTNLLREAEDEYYKCRSLEELYELDTKMDVLKSFLNESRISNSQAEADFKVLQRKIRRSIAVEEGVDYDMDNDVRGNRGQDNSYTD